jgi:predicted CoA-binding protein
MTPVFDLRRYQDPLTIQRVIHTAKRIAIVGLSNNPLRASYFVGFYLKRHGYQVIPVNPRETATSTQVVNEKTSTTMMTSAGDRAETACAPHSHRQA